MRSNLYFAFVAAGLALSAFAFSGCDALSRLQEFTGSHSQDQRATAATSATRGGSEALNTGLSPSARQAKANAELLHEMYKVVFDHEPADRGEFGNLVDSMNQGASLEGMYNGFVHSSEYARLEESGTQASPGASKYFLEEVRIFGKELTPKAQLDDPGAISRSSIYALKRILGDEALKVIWSKKTSTENLAAWYSLFAVHSAEKGVDFGIPLRNKSDDAFHRAWAKTASSDSLEWEVLNRVHRLLNFANQRKPGK